MPKGMNLLLIGKLKFYRVFLVKVNEVGEMQS